MHLDVIKAAAEITREAVSKAPTTMGVAPLNNPDLVAQFLDKIAHKLESLLHTDTSTGRR
jgi:hypothetical protein